MQTKKETNLEQGKRKDSSSKMIATTMKKKEKKANNNANLNDKAKQTEAEGEEKAKEDEKNAAIEKASQPTDVPKLSKKDLEDSKTEEEKR